MKLIDLLKTLDFNISYTVLLVCNGLEDFGTYTLNDLEINKHLDCKVEYINFVNNVMEITIKVSV